MRVCHRRRLGVRPAFEAKSASINALSKQSPTDPIKATNRDWRARSVNAQEVKGVPWSECMTVPESGWRFWIAMASAEVTTPEVADWSMDQPTTRRASF